MNEILKELVFKAGFAGSDLSNTQPGTCHETALKNLFELTVFECGIYTDMYLREVKLGTINPAKVTAFEFLQECLLKDSHVTE